MGVPLWLQEKGIFSLCGASEKFLPQAGSDPVLTDSSVQMPSDPSHFEGTATCSSPGGFAVCQDRLVRANPSLHSSEKVLPLLK